MILIPMPDHVSFRWQMLTQITAMEELGLLPNCRWLVYTQLETSRQLTDLMAMGVAQIEVWQDWPRDVRYNGAMKPWLVGKFLSKHPELVFENLEVIDPDVLLLSTKRITADQQVVYGTNTDSYTGVGYLKSKGVWEDLCSMVEVDPVYASEFTAIGAQLIWTGLPGLWWEDTARRSITAYNYLQEHESDVQAWCAEMYVTQLSLIRDGRIPAANPDMGMVWANGLKDGLARARYFHDAGVTEANPDHFCKLTYKDSQPFRDEIVVSDESASSVYVEYIRKAAVRFANII